MIKRRGYLVPTFVALLGAGFAFSLSGVRNSKNTDLGLVELGKDYYVGVSLIELTETNADGEAWDSYNQSGPDIVVEIHWKGSRIYRSTTKEDTFLAHWSETEIDLRDVALSGSGTSADSLIQGARINIRKDESLEVKIFDSDLVDLEFVDSKQFKTSELKIGENASSFKTPGLKRLNLRVKAMAGDGS